MKNFPEQNKKYVEKQLKQLDDNFFDYICYWNEKYYRNGFCDGVQIISGCIIKLIFYILLIPYLSATLLYASKKSAINLSYSSILSFFHLEISFWQFCPQYISCCLNHFLNSTLLSGLQGYSDVYHRTVRHGQTHSERKFSDTPAGRI